MEKTWKAALAAMIGSLACTFAFHEFDRDIPRDLWWFTICFGAVIAYVGYEGAKALIAVPKERWKQYFKALAPISAVAATVLPLFLIPGYLLFRAKRPFEQSLSPTEALVHCLWIGAGIMLYLSFMAWQVSMNFTEKDAQDCYDLGPWRICLRAYRFCSRKIRWMIAEFRSA